MSLPTNGSHLIAYDANDLPLYEGWAIRKGASSGSSIWRITKYIWATGTDGNQVNTEQQWADGNELYDNEWDERASLSYS